MLMQPEVAFSYHICQFQRTISIPLGSYEENGENGEKVYNLERTSPFRADAAFFSSLSPPLLAYVQEWGEWGGGGGGGDKLWVQEQIIIIGVGYWSPHHKTLSDSPVWYETSRFSKY